jgi:hypothetical protein
MTGKRLLAALAMTGAAFTGRLVVTAPAAQAATPHCVQTGEWSVVSHSRYTMQRHHREFGGYVGRVTLRPRHLQLRVPEPLLPQVRHDSSLPRGVREVLLR